MNVPGITFLKYFFMFSNKNRVTQEIYCLIPPIGEN